jgi:hypothetical protein
MSTTLVPFAIPRNEMVVYCSLVCGLSSKIRTGTPTLTEQWQKRGKGTVLHFMDWALSFTLWIGRGVTLYGLGVGFHVMDWAWGSTLWIGRGVPFYGLGVGFHFMDLVWGSTLWIGRRVPHYGLGVGFETDKT